MRRKTYNAYIRIVALLILGVFTIQQPLYAFPEKNIHDALMLDSAFKQDGANTDFTADGLHEEAQAAGIEPKDEDSNPPPGGAGPGALANRLRVPVRRWLAGPLALPPAQVDMLTSGIVWYEHFMAGGAIDFQQSHLRSQREFIRFLAHGFEGKESVELFREGIIHERIHNILHTLGREELDGFFNRLEQEINRRDPRFREKFQHEFGAYTEKLYGGRAGYVYLEEIITKYYSEKVRLLGHPGGGIAPVFKEVSDTIEGLVRGLTLPQFVREALPGDMGENPPANMHVLFDITSGYQTVSVAEEKQTTLTDRKWRKSRQLQAVAKAAGIPIGVRDMAELNELVKSMRSRWGRMMSLANLPDPETDVLSFELDPEGARAEASYGALNDMRRTRPADFNAMLAQMRLILQRRTGSDMTESPPVEVIRAFTGFAAPHVRALCEPLFSRYGVDPYTTITLEWGPRRKACFRRRGRWGREIVLNTGLLLDDGILEGEILRDVLNPLARRQLEYLHFEIPEIFDLVGVEIGMGESRPVEPGYIANVWDWELRKDGLDFLLDVSKAAESSTDAEMASAPEEIDRLVNNTLTENLRNLRDSKDRECQVAHARVEREIEQIKEREGRSFLTVKEGMAFLRQAFDAMERSRRHEDQHSNEALQAIIGANVENFAVIMSRSKDRRMRDMAEGFENIQRQGKAVVQALVEMFALEKELELLDEKGAESILAALRENKDIPDPLGDFERLLLAGEHDRRYAVLQYIASRSVINGRPGTQVGASALAEAWVRDPESTRKALDRVTDFLEGKITRYEPLGDIGRPVNNDEILDLVETHNVELAVIRFTDPERRLEGQTKAVLMPVGSPMIGLMEEGISFDGSSIVASDTGASMADIEQSDFISVFTQPERTQVFETEGGRHVISIDTVIRGTMDVMSESEQKIIRLQREHKMEPRYKPVSIDREEYGLHDATERAMEELRRHGIRTVKLMLSDWTEEATMVEVDIDHLPAAFAAGLELSAGEAQYLPATGPKEGLRAFPDPYSLSIVRYPRTSHGKKHAGMLEAVMTVDVRHADGKTHYEGDFRHKLIELVAEAERKGFIPIMAPEPEVIFLRKLPDGSLVTADRGKYYDDLLNIPSDVRATLEDVIVAAESAGINIRYIHHEVAPGQYEMPYEHGPALEAADRTALYMHIVREAARRNGLIACFMPKPVKEFDGEGVNGSGMHCHQSLMALNDMEVHGRRYSAGQNVFHDPGGPFGLSKTAISYIGGLSRYMPAILRVTNPDPNSYLRLVPHAEAPTDLAIGSLNRSAAFRVPKDRGPGARIECRIPDASGNGNVHARFYAMLLAGLEGVYRNIEPPVAVDRNVWEMTDEEKRELGIIQLPGGEYNLEPAIAMMNNPAGANPMLAESAGEILAFADMAYGPQGTPVRDFLSQPIGVRHVETTASSMQAAHPVVDGGVTPGDREIALDNDKMSDVIFEGAEMRMAFLRADEETRQARQDAVDDFMGHMGQLVDAAGLAIGDEGDAVRTRGERARHVRAVLDRRVSALIERDDAHVAPLQDYLDSGQIAKTVTNNHIGLIATASALLDNIGARETLERMAVSGTEFTIAVDCETQEEVNAILNLNLPGVKEARVAKTGESKRDRAGALKRFLQRKKILPQFIGMVDTPTDSLEEARAELADLDIYVGIPTPASAEEGRIVSLQGIFHNVIEAVATQQAERIFAIDLPAIEVPTGDAEWREKLQQFEEAITYLKHA